MGSITRHVPSVSRSGFTLLEVLVSLALISIIGMGIYSWITGSLLTMERVRQHNKAREAGRNALAFMADVNPMLLPNGSGEMGDMLVAWQARQIDPQDSERGRRALGAGFELALFNTEVTVTQAGEDVTAFSLYQVGYLLRNRPMQDQVPRK